MSVLSDVAILAALHATDPQRRLVIERSLSQALQPSSVDLRLGYSFRRFDKGVATPMNPLKDSGAHTREVALEGNDTFVLMPGEFALATTIERVEVPHHLAARLDGKSSLGRIGLIVHSTAGWFDPGFKGEATLELYNLAPYPIELTPGMWIAQMSFHFLSEPARIPYGHPLLNSKYQDQAGATASAYDKNKVQVGTNPD